MNIKIRANSVPDTDHQALADALYSALAAQTNTISVEVTALVDRPTEVVFLPTQQRR